MNNFYQTQMAIADVECQRDMAKYNKLLSRSLYACVAGIFFLLGSIALYDLNSQIITFVFMLLSALFMAGAFFSAAFFNNHFYKAETVYRKRVKDLKALLEDDKSARRTGVSITPNDVVKFAEEKAEFRLKPFIIYIVSFLIIWLLILGQLYYFVVFTPDGWQKYKFARPYLLDNLQEAMASDKYTSDDNNLYTFTDDEIYDIFYDRDYADAAVDFTFKNAVRGSDYDTYLLDTDKDGKSRWLVIQYVPERKIFMAETGDIFTLELPDSDAETPETG